MLENGKINSEKLQQVMGGTLTFENEQKLYALIEKLLEKKWSTCRNCGEKYLKPDASLPNAYGDFSLCPDCNKEVRLGLEVRKQIMQGLLERIKNS